ncbi:MAG: CPBP family intramembrane metalloprotease [Candidatus Uhrbacteria bacterium]|nr:CPBP family intramembrane metalloprotease [Candidatus Uhrbacteria bacterium]
MTTRLSSRSALLFILVPMLLFQLIGASLYFVALPGFSGILYSTTKILMIAWPVGWFLAGFRPAVYRGSKKHRVLYGLGSGILFSALIVGTFFLFEPFFRSLVPTLQDVVQTFGIWSWYIPFAIFFSIFHSLFEEVYWRWFVLGGLRLLMKTNPAIALGSLAFSAHHVVILWQFFPLTIALLFGLTIAIAGACWCLLYQKTNSLVTSWLSHILVDATILTIGYVLLF